MKYISLGIAITLAVILCFKKHEHFTLWSPKPPEWFLPQTQYNPKDWLTPTQPDRISKPVCLPYNRGDPGVLNFNGSSYRLWRF